MELIPCSHIGHLCRVSTYSFKGDEQYIKYRNHARAVEVWLDDYKKLFYAATPGQSIDWTGVSSQSQCVRLVL